MRYGRKEPCAFCDRTGLVETEEHWTGVRPCEFCLGKGTILFVFFGLRMIPLFRLARPGAGYLREQVGLE